MKTQIVSIVLVFAVCMAGLTGIVSATTGTAGEVYDFAEGTYPQMFLPVNQSVDTWNEVTGIEVDDGDWLNVTYYDIVGNATTEYFYVEDVEGNIDISWNETDWGNYVLGYFAAELDENLTFEGIEVSVNNDTVENLIPIPPVFEEVDGTVDSYDGVVTTIVPIADREIYIGDLKIWFESDYAEVEEDYEDDLAYNYTGETAIMVEFDDEFYPLGDWAMYYFEDEEVFIQVYGEITDDTDELKYIVVSNYDGLSSDSVSAATVRYWQKEDASFTAKYFTGSEVTFNEYAGSESSTYIVPDGSIVKLTIGKGAMDDYVVTLSPDTYTIDRKWYAYFNAEDVSDIGGDAEVTAIEGVYLNRMTVYTFYVDENDDEDVVFVDSIVGWTIDNTYEFGTKNWYQYGTLTTEVKRAGWITW